MSKKKMSFEKSLQRLEDIVSEMENAEPELEKALSLFSEGVELVKYCSSKLDETKKKIEILIKEGDKEMVKKDFNEKEGE